jgi:hypothetical protein
MPPRKKTKFPHLRIKWKNLPHHWGYILTNEWCIYLDKSMDDKTTIDIASHEIAHKILPQIDEEYIDLLGRHVADVLTRIGFARIHEGDK